MDGSTTSVNAVTAAPQYDAVIIGAGFSGLCAAIKLRRAGITNFVVLERAGEVGGTWWANTYPGCACDIPSHLYSLSFAQNPDWSRRYPSQPELLAYLKRVADRHALRSQIRFDHTVTDSQFVEDGGFWRVTTAQGAFTGRVLIAAVGGLSIPALPAIPGIESFTGKHMHSAQWDASYDFTGKRVAVIGTGASSIQIVPAIAPSVAKLTLFQRTPPWIQPRNDRPITGFEKFLLRWVKPLQWLYRAKIFLQHEFRLIFFSNPALMQYGHAAALKHMHAAIRDPQLRAKLTPNHVMGCKRVLVSDDYYPALARPNVELVTTGIREITPMGLRTQDGAFHEVDCIVLGTGFQVTENPNSAMVRGRGGRSLVEVWRDSGEEGYLGTVVKDFPNLFLMIGPNAGTGHNSLVYVCEQQVKFVVRVLKLMRMRGARTIEVRPAVQDAFNVWAQAWFKRSVWGSGCKSWYQNRHGKVIGIWPGSSNQLRKRLSHFDPADFLFDREATGL